MGHTVDDDGHDREEGLREMGEREWGRTSGVWALTWKRIGKGDECMGLPLPCKHLLFIYGWFAYVPLQICEIVHIHVQELIWNLHAFPLAEQSI